MHDAYDEPNYPDGATAGLAKAALRQFAPVGRRDPFSVLWVRVVSRHVV